MAAWIVSTNRLTTLTFKKKISFRCRSSNTRTLKRVNVVKGSAGAVTGRDVSIGIKACLTDVSVIFTAFFSVLLTGTQNVCRAIEYFSKKGSIAVLE